ncbi:MULTISPECIES: ArnT family glycosyltransferase [unclassified Sphingobium]|uniref:ArnT family glycosyltransferase n=1 Tax=unclassified Sphingobium TaxID=2611147 RepID=UPI0022256F28|nr:MULTISPECIES: hypothetical protein [unclassified Sphingobium]MCW2348787.1 hypothetical protein [Sphingobium sp. B12D2B]MCW2383334.1 hypothetical protein [Sphingobium sp. B2D3B]MCW2399691.1 hypothetical protein [Sphingobium sp. B2D3C]
MATVVTRAPWFGDLAYHEDENYYLVFAKAMHQGAVPYVDVWDRKPFGLFIIYWLIAFLPGNGIEATQLVAGLFAFCTALTISSIVRRFYPAIPACFAGVAYLACLPMLIGAGGQSPVFYNLFIVLAVSLLLPSADRQAQDEMPIRRAYIAMLLCGLAITVKPTAIVEGVFMGIVAAYHALHPASPSGRTRWVRIIQFALLGAAPTLMIFFGFAAIGKFEDYWFASIRSVGLKAPQSLDVTIQVAKWLSLILCPLILMSVAGAHYLVRTPDKKTVAVFLVCWMFAALGGFLMIPNFWDHYALPLLPPLVVLASPIFARKGTGFLWLLVLIIWAALISGWPDRSRVLERRGYIEQLARAIDGARHGGCFYLFEGPPVLYALTDACHVTSRLFPQHMSFSLESPAIGLDPSEEMRRILSRRPAVIALSHTPLVRPHNEATRAILMQGLQRNYRLIARLPMNEAHRPRYEMEVWALPAPPPHRRFTAPGSKSDHLLAFSKQF